ncbi:MAG: sensor histidine kinase [Oceanobacter sp.]
MKFEYLAGAVIHDLKNQLQTLLACEEEALAKIPQEYHSYLSPIWQKTNRLQNDTLQMMLLFRMEKEGGFPLDDAWPYDTALEAIEASQAQFPNVRFENSIEEEIQGIYNDDLVRLALMTLITNSVQAGATRIKLSASDDGELVIRVEDNGPGFDQAILNGEEITTKPGGSGVGLYLVRKIAEMHGISEQDGRVTCSNRPKGGAEVCMHLPCALQTA